MAYYNRRKQLINTLRSIEASTVKDIECIITDDGSDPKERIEDLATRFTFLRVIRVEPEQKTWTNPCIPYNMAFREAQGDIVVIQNPECAHIGDVLAHVLSNLNEQTYLSYSCLSLNKETTEAFYKNPGIASEIAKDMRIAAIGNGDNGWYNHSSITIRFYHFCSAIFNTNLKRLNGFDERFANGFCWEDEDFANRTKYFLNRVIVDNPIVVHQWHDCSHLFNAGGVKLEKSNKHIYDCIQQGILLRWGA